MEKLKDKAAAAAQAILEPGIATDGGQQMNREQFGIFIKRFATASGLTFSAITDFLLVVPVFDYDPAFTDPGMYHAVLSSVCLITMQLMERTPARTRCMWSKSLLTRRTFT